MERRASEPRIVIAGAGHAGGRAAEALRAAGFAGPMLLIGAERYPPYERPPLSKEVLAGAMPVEKTYVKPLSYYEESGIALRLGTRVSAIDRANQRVLIEGGGSEAYDLLLLTTGARARRLRVPGGEGARVFYLRDIEDCLALRERLQPGSRIAVIGAGFIGLEVAAIARQRGASVAILEVAPAPLGRCVAPEIGGFFARLHRDRGADLRTQSTVAAIEDIGDAVRLVTDAGETILADLVVAGIGAVPNTELGRQAGLAVDDGILVDSFGRSSDPAIFAAGDVTRHLNPILGRRLRLEAWQNAQNQAIAVAKVMAGGQEPFAEVPWFWTDQHDVNLQIAGVPESWDRLVWRGAPTDRAFTLFYLREGRVVGANTVNNPRDIRFAKMLIAGGRPVDADRLADVTVKLQDLARS